MKFVDVKNDVAFHKIFGNANKPLPLVSFLNAVMYADGANRIVSTTVEYPNLFPPLPKGKTSILNVWATDEAGKKFIVELQFADKEGFETRVQDYRRRDRSTETERKESFSLHRPRYCISFLDFLFTQNPNYFSTHQTVDIETGENLLKDVKYFFIELRKFGKKEEELVTMVDKWTYFIKNAQNLDVIPSNVDDEGLKTAYLDADQQTWTKKERDAYDDFGIYLTDIAMRELFLQKKGKQEGAVEMKMEMIRAMHDAGLPIPQIAAISGKTEDEVRALIANNRR
jgi:predicted transposase/invertase (TIGR01784 family)